MLTFFVILLVSLLASTLTFVTRLLHLSVPDGLKRRSLLDLELSEDFKNALLEVELPEKVIVDGKKIVSLDFQKTCLIVLINRDNKFITPNNLTKLHSGDKLMVMMNSEDEEEKIKLALGI